MPAVLLIDDDVELLRQMGSAFTAKGWDVMFAADGAAGLRTFTERQPHLVVTDIIMPVREGVETIVDVKKVAPEIKVIAISGGMRVGAETFLSLAKHLGADAVLSKPFRLSELTGLGERLLAGDAA